MYEVANAGPVVAPRVSVQNQQTDKSNTLTGASVNGLFFQAKLTVGSPNDRLEHEADAVADSVMRMPAENFVQRKCASCEEEDKLQRKPITSFIQNSGIQGGSVASDAVSNKINASKGGGSSMDSHTQSFMQSRFGNDFSDVKIHAGGDAIQMNRALNAKAFTVGNDIYFNEGKYSPNSDSGKHLLAHELTHTVQQGGSAGDTLRRDLAIELPTPNAVFEGFNGEQIDDAIDFNTKQWMSAMDILIIKDVLGIGSTTSDIDEEFINATGRYQAENNILADGKIGGVTATRLASELLAEGNYLGRTEGRQLLGATRRMARRGIAMSIGVTAAQISTFGSATYLVNFGISDRSANGWIIQHVVFSANAVDCTGAAATSNNAAPPNNYWEGWRVINGVIQCGFTGICVGANDTFTTMNESPNTRGTIQVTGRVTFVPDYQLNTPPWVVGGGHPAGGLPHRNTPPPNWSDFDALLHQMTITYNNCITPQPNLTINTIP